MTEQTLDALLESARRGIDDYLTTARDNGQIDAQSYQQAAANVFPALQEWLTDEATHRLSPQVQPALKSVIAEERWEDLVNAFRQPIRFGTGGIRGMMAFDRGSIEKLAESGISAPILKGPNTINDIVLLLKSVGVAQYGREQNPPLEKVVIGYDSRVRGHDFAKIVAELFLHAGYTVYFFDEPCPYPEMTFAIPYKDIKGDIGILISASHNDYRYNGYKLSCSNGSQFDPEQRDEMYEKYIAHATTKQIGLIPFEDAADDKLVFLGGEERVEGFNYLGREDRVLNIHQPHLKHVQSFLLTPDLAKQQRESDSPLRIAFCAFHGAGRRAIPRLLSEVGFNDVRIITEGGLNDLNGLFPSFESAAGKEQQPDPGDERAARTAIEAFKKQGTLGSFDDVDILIGTDPDADRCGVVVKVPADQRGLFGGQDWQLIPADSMWALLLWYRFHRETEQHGQVQDADKKFVVLSHTTSDSIALLAKKHGLGSIKTWVGFAALAAAVRDVWEQRELLDLKEGRHPTLGDLCHPFVCEYTDIEFGARSNNVAAMEQSNGFSILGSPPPDARSLGVGGHVRDKDGTLAALLVAEIAAWAKQQGTTIYELMDRHIHLDPDIGLFVSHYEPDPLDGEYPGIQGDRKKKDILGRALQQFARVGAGETVEFAGRKVTSAVMYRTGKYDAIYPPTAEFQFPDEGLRFYLGTEYNHVTVRPSGTGNSLRFHVQLHEPNPGPELADLIGHKQRLYTQIRRIADELRNMLEAPRS
ncbi:MAG: hypothetical protein O3A00_17320 [Planctomycetota bacterium]|nr:hypothetical protein [Planctomycetota bacterium]